MGLFVEGVRTSQTEDRQQEPRINRRIWLAGAVSLVAATAAAGLLTPALLPAEEEKSPDPTRVTVFKKLSELTSVPI